jgi:hypothetical protein
LPANRLGRLSRQALSLQNTDASAVPKILSGLKKWPSDEMLKKRYFFHVFGGPKTIPSQGGWSDSLQRAGR